MTLSETKLLERCVRGATQNRNECINSMVWVRCPKHKHHGVKVIRCAVASAVCHFHSGAASRVSVMNRLHSSWNVYKKGIREKGQEAAQKIRPAGFCKREEMPPRDAAAAYTQRRGPQGG